MNGDMTSEMISSQTASYVTTDADFTNERIGWPLPPDLVVTMILSPMETLFQSLW